MPSVPHGITSPQSRTPVRDGWLAHELVCYHLLLSYAEGEAKGEEIMWYMLAWVVWQVPATIPQLPRLDVSFFSLSLTIALITQVKLGYLSISKSKIA